MHDASTSSLILVFHEHIRFCSLFEDEDEGKYLFIFIILNNKWLYIKRNAKWPYDYLMDF